MEQMLAWALINRQFSKVQKRQKPLAEDRYYEAFAGWSGPFRRIRAN